MTLRLMQSALSLVVAACSASPSQPAQAATERPFATAEVASFDAPWAMDFLPGSGVRMTSSALVTEKSGKLWLIDVNSGERQEVAGVPALEAA